VLGLHGGGGGKGISCDRERGKWGWGTWWTRVSIEGVGFAVDILAAHRVFILHRYKDTCGYINCVRHVYLWSLQDDHKP
jgi:hypothetical protein